jgi:hypothetical protein
LANVKGIGVVTVYSFAAPINAGGAYQNVMSRTEKQV